jgi:hypothetical protein
VWPVKRKRSVSITGAALSVGSGIVIKDSLRCTGLRCSMQSADAASSLA